MTKHIRMKAPLSRRPARVQPAQVLRAALRPAGGAAPFQERQQIGAAEAPLPPPADPEAGQPARVSPAAQRHPADVQERRRLGDVEQLRLVLHGPSGNRSSLTLFV